MWNHDKAAHVTPDPPLTTPHPPITRACITRERLPAGRAAKADHLTCAWFNSQEEGERSREWRSV